MKNEDLKRIYDEMHEKGALSWFGDGKEERELILKMGDPWNGLKVYEIGCGEGDLAMMIHEKLADIFAIDYSEKALDRAIQKTSRVAFMVGDYRCYKPSGIERIVMQGVLEHLDDPFSELKWMMDNLLTGEGDVITSSPCFLNPRGIVWKALDMLGAVMSKTDLHHLDPWQFQDFASANHYSIEIDYCDQSWGKGARMIEDFRIRIPLALRDAGIYFEQRKIDDFLNWLQWSVTLKTYGATAVYRIKK